MRAAGIVNPSISRLAPQFALAAVAMFFWGGVACQRAEPDAAAEVLDEPPEKMELAWREGEIAGAPASTPIMIKEGPAPLFYLSEMPAMLRVVDTSGDKVLAEAAVGARTIVLVDTQRGVVFGGRTLVAGPLAGRRRYAIYMIPRGESVSRFGVSKPVERDEPEDAADALEPAPALEE